MFHTKWKVKGLLMGATNSMPQKPNEVARINRSAPEIYKEYRVFDHLYTSDIIIERVDKKMLLELHLERFNNNILFFIKKTPIEEISFKKIEKLREATDREYALHKRIMSDRKTKEIVVDFDDSEKHVYMCRHFLVGLTENIGFLQNTQVLQCCCNYITKIPHSIKHLKNLKMLILSRNRIMELPEELGCCKELRELDLSNNLIEEIPNSIASLKSLNVLNLSKNNIKTLNPAIGKLTALKSLFVDNNKLTHISLEVLKLPFLSQLTTENNNLMTNVESMMRRVGKHTLFEECAREIIRNNLEIPSNMPKFTKNHLITVQECAFCGGPFFDYYYEVQSMHEFDGILYPTMYKMCTKHYSTHEERIEALFASDHKHTKPIKLIEADLPSVTEIFEPFCHSEDLMVNVKNSYDQESGQMPLICLSLYNSKFFKSYVQSKKRTIEDVEEGKFKKNCFS